MESGITPVYLRELRKGRGGIAKKYLLGLVVVAALFGGILFLLHSIEYRPSHSQDGLSGDRVVLGAASVEEVYYDDGATEADARRLGEFFLKAGYFDGHTPASAQVLRTADGYAVSMVMRWGNWDNPLVVAEIRGIIPRLSQEVFGGAPVEVRLCHSVLENHNGRLALTVMKTVRAEGQ
jgi:hypothetical protein